MFKQACTSAYLWNHFYILQPTTPLLLEAFHKHYFLILFLKYFLSKEGILDISTKTSISTHSHQRNIFDSELTTFKGKIA